MNSIDHLKKSGTPLLSDILGHLLCGETQVEYIANPGNTGDAIIAMGVSAVISKLGISISQSASVILVAGGGNLVPHYSNMRERIKQIPRSGKRVIILPSTAAWCFDLLKEFRDLILIARESETFQRAAKAGVRVIQAHDCAFDLDFSEWLGAGSRCDLLRAFRTDCESSGKAAPQDNRDLSEIYGNRLWDFESARSAGRKFIGDINQYDQIETDRLHVAIVAAMLGKTVKVYPGNYHKNRSMFDASLKHFPNVSFIPDVAKSDSLPEIAGVISRFDAGKWHSSLPSFDGTPPDIGKIRGDASLFDPWPRGHYLEHVPESGVLELNGGCTLDKNGWTLTSSSELVVDLSWFPSVEELLLHCRSFAPIKHWKRIRGRCLDLSTNWCADNYAHFLIEAVGRLMVAEKAGFSANDFDYIRLPLPRSHQRDYVLERFGIDRKKLIAPDHDFTLMQFDVLFRPSMAGVSKQYHPELAPWIRSKGGIPYDGPEKVFLRRSARERLADNGQEAEAALKQRGFTVIDPSWAPIGSWANARIVISAHQAGLADLAFCRPGAKVLELLPSDHQFQYYPNWAKQSGHDYYCLMCQSNTSRPRGTRNVSPYNFRIPIQDMMKWVDEMGF